jgi:biuret amidohydrolase
MVGRVEQQAGDLPGLLARTFRHRRVGPRSDPGLAGVDNEGGRFGLKGLREGTVPYPWPYDGALDVARFALVVAGAQQWWTGRCVDMTPALAAVDRTAAMVRRYGTHVVFLRHAGQVVGSRGPAYEGLWPPHRRGRRGNDLAVRSVPTDAVVDAAGIDGFFGSSLDTLLRRWGCTHLAMAGFGLEGPVHSTLRSANDRGYECLLLADACAAAGEQTRRGALSTVTMSGGIFGAVGTTAHLAALLEAARRRPRTSSDLMKGPART